MADAIPTAGRISNAECYCYSYRLQSRGLESLTAGLQSLRLASRLKPWLRTIDGLERLMAASHGLRLYKQEN